MIGHQPTNDDLMTLTHQDYCNIPQSAVQTAYEVAVSSNSMQPTAPSVPNVTVTTDRASVQAPTVVPSPAQRFNHVNLSSQTYLHVTPNMIHTVDFIRYTFFLLGETDGILKFYSDVQTQGAQYNILSKHIDHITPSESLSK